MENFIFSVNVKWNTISPTENYIQVRFQRSLKENIKPALIHMKKMRYFLTFQTELSIHTDWWNYKEQQKLNYVKMHHPIVYLLRIFPEYDMLILQ